MANEVENVGGYLAEFLDPLLGQLGGQLPSVLMTLLILIAGVFFAKLLSSGVAGVIAKSGFQMRISESAGDVNIADTIRSLVYYIVLLMVLLIVLERMNITAVLDPLKNMVDQFMGALPNIIGAGIIFYAGWIVAKLSSSIVSLAARKVDLTLESKGYSPDFKASKFLGAFVFGGVLLPITVAGFQFLNIKPISEPAIEMIAGFMSAVPNIVAAGLILVVAYYLGKFIVYMLTGLLEGMNVDQIPEKMGATSLFNENRSLTRVIGAVVMFFIMLAATTAAVEKLQITLVSGIFAKFIEFGGGVVLGSIILLIGNALASLAYKHLSENAESSSIANIARFAILGLVLAMGLKAMGLADNIVTMAFGFTLGSVAIAVALAFGLGGREAASVVSKKWAEKIK